MTRELELLHTALKILRMDKGDEYRYNVAIPLMEAIAELEAPKTCELASKAIKLIKILDAMLETHPDEVYGLCVKYDYYEPKGKK